MKPAVSVSFSSILAALGTSGPGVASLRDPLLRYRVDDKRPEDYFAWATCVLALQAVSKGNFGIGSVLVDGTGAILESGHNEVFNPRFRSDGHAEMVVMTRFEERNPRKVDLRACTLYTSLESCPMCLCRLISSGIGRVLYVAADDIGGMVRRGRSLPPVWRDLMKHQEHRQAECSAQLKKAALDIFLANVQQLNAQLAAQDAVTKRDSDN